MTRFPVFGTYYICLSHHVLTWNYSSCVSCISHLWWNTFKLAVWYWFASWIWFLACIASSLMNATYDETVLTWQSDIDCTFHMVSCSVSNLLKCLLLSYHIIGVNMPSRPFFVHIPSSYHDFAFHQSSVRQYHAWMSSEERMIFLFLVGMTSQCKINKAEGNWQGIGWWCSFRATETEVLYRFYSAILPTRFARQRKARQST